MSGSTGDQIARDRRRANHGAGLKANELLFELLAEDSHGADQAFFQGDSGGPAQRGQAADIELLGSSIGFDASQISPENPRATARQLAE